MNITPETYARWRESALGALTEQLEQRAIFSLVGDPSGLRVLDVGCGDGVYALEVSQRGGKVFGLDRSLPMLEAARTRAISSGACVSWCQGAAQSLPFRDTSFDLVLAVTALCWIPEPVVALKEMNRVLRPGGAVIVGELGSCSLWALARRFRGWLGTSNWNGAHFWTARELRELLVRAGLRAGDVRDAVYYPPSETLTRLMGCIEGASAHLGPYGAAFIAVRSIKQ
jgi:ubiquinone/menaquinone biosynthesis C-methylase UbiE